MIIDINPTTLHTSLRLEHPVIYLLYGMIILTVISTSTQTNTSLDCINDFNLKYPNDPSPYPNDASVEWYITAPIHRRVILTFYEFYLEENRDTLEVLDMVNTRNIKHYTGEQKHFPPFLSQGYGISLLFTSSRTGRRKGFNISVSCYETSGNVPARLVDGPSPGEGFLELSSQSGEWMRVCEDSLPLAVAEVICGELGYPGVEEVTYVEGSCLSDHIDETCTRATTCQDNTYRLEDCEPVHSPCSSHKVVKINCFEPGYSGCFIKSETMKLKNGLPFISTARCISSCKSDDIQAVAIMNDEECFCTTYAEAQLEDASNCNEKTEEISRMSVYSASFGFCEELNDTIDGSWDPNITWFASTVHLTCMEGYSLNGSDTLQCVPGVTPYYPHWNDTMPSCIMDVTTKDFMKSTSLTTLDTGMTSDYTITLETTTTVTTTDSVTTTANLDAVTINTIIILLSLMIVGIILIGIAYIIYYRRTGKYPWKIRSGYAPRLTNDGQSTSSYNRIGAENLSSRPSGGPRFSLGMLNNGSTRGNTTPISVIPLNNLPQDILPPAPPSPQPSNTSDIPLTMLPMLQNHPRTQNHYVSSNSRPNPYYYASSADTRTSLEEPYQEPSSMGMANHSYEDTGDRRGQSTVTLQTEHTLATELSMISRPLPHRPFSSNCNEGPTLPPRDKSLHSKNRIPLAVSLRQRKSKTVNENNNLHLGACASEYNAIQDLPNMHQHATSCKRLGQPSEIQFYHTLEKDEPLRTFGQERNDREPPTSRAVQGNTPDPFYHLLENDAHRSDSGNNNHLLYHTPHHAPDRTDRTDSTMMIDNILYTPLKSSSKK